MCYYIHVVCETCKVEQKLPPVFCDKLFSGIICTKFNSTDTSSNVACKTVALVACQQSFDESSAEMRLFDILEARMSWTDWTTCPCGFSRIDLDSSLTGCSDDDCDVDDYDQTNYNETNRNYMDFDDVDFDALWREIYAEVDYVNDVA